MTRLLLSTAVAAIAAGPALAQSLPADGSVTLAFNFNDDFEGDSYGTENYTIMLTGRTDLALAGGFGLGFSAGYIQEQNGGEFYSDRLLFGLHPHLRLDGGQIGAFVVSEHNPTFDERATLYGIEGQADYGAADVFGYAGIIDTSDGDEVRIFGLAGAYDVSTTLEVYTLHRSEFDPGFYDEAFTFNALGVNYAPPGAPLVLTGEIGRFENFGPGSQVSVMATYNLGGGQKTPFNHFYSNDYYYD